MRDKISTEQELESHEDVMVSIINLGISTCIKEGGFKADTVIKAILKYHPPQPDMQAKKPQVCSGKAKISEGVLTAGIRMPRLCGVDVARVILGPSIPSCQS